MSFYFVDRIFSYKSGKKIRGIKSVTRNESFYYPLTNHHRVLSPAVVSEALAQLGSWLMLVSTDFKSRSVLLSGESTEYMGVCRQGDVIELEVEIISWQDEVVVSKSTAKVGDRVIQQTSEARGYLLDASELTDEDMDRQQFAKLYRPENMFTPAHQTTFTTNSFWRNNFQKNAIRFIDSVHKDNDERRIRAYKNFSLVEPFFASHFPNKPVVPGVILMTLVGEACQFFVKTNIDLNFESEVLVPRKTYDVRFRKFVEPGDQCEVDLSLISVEPETGLYTIKALIFADGKLVMQAKMDLERFDRQKVEAFLIDEMPDKLLGNFGAEKPSSSNNL